MKLLRFKKIFLCTFLVVFVTTKVWASNPPHVSHKLATMLLQAVALMGVSYHWGGNTPSSGLDCSGFVRYVFKKSLGITLPRTAAEMAKVGTEVDVSDLQPGDLLFFNTRHTRNHYMGISHIGIYLGDNKFIQAPHNGEQIQVTDFAGYWRSHFILAKRIDEKLMNENEIDDDSVNDSEEEILSDIPDHPTHYAAHHHKHHGKSSKGSAKGHGAHVHGKSAATTTAKPSAATKTATAATSKNAKAGSSSATNTSQSAKKSGAHKATHKKSHHHHHSE